LTSKKSVEKKASENGDGTEVVKDESMMAPLELTSSEKIAENIINEVVRETHHVCIVCGSDKTTRRMSGVFRWHDTTEGMLCHRCYTHSLDYKHPDEVATQ